MPVIGTSSHLVAMGVTSLSKHETFDSLDPPRKYINIICGQPDAAPSGRDMSHTHPSTIEEQLPAIIIKGSD